MTQRMELAKDYTISRVLNGCWQLSKGPSLQGTLNLKDVMKAFHMLVEQDLRRLTVRISTQARRNSSASL